MSPVSPAQKQLWLGALKSAVSSACGLLVSLPLADPQNFSVTSFGGWKHLGLVIGVVVLAGEARFWKQWAGSNGISQ
jgi:hypothetical protein